MNQPTHKIIWKALADPTRRKLLDRLRSGPKTTGQLCGSFKTSRYAVMKHLGVLETAGLVFVRREGRERWNHLNAVPLQRVFERWVTPFESHFSDGLLRLQKHVEEKESQVVSANAVKNTPWGVVRIELEITIKGSPERVWRALVDETNSWWNRDFHTSSKTKGFIIEPRLGGRVYEDWGGGAGQVWYTVVGLDPGVSLSLLGHLSPAFGGPAATQLELKLGKSGRNTTLSLSDVIYGQVNEDRKSETREGWLTLFDAGLRAWVESKNG